MLGSKELLFFSVLIRQDYARLLEMNLKSV